MGCGLVDTGTQGMSNLGLVLHPLNGRSDLQDELALPRSWCAHFQGHAAVQAYPVAQQLSRAWQVKIMLFMICPGARNDWYQVVVFWPTGVYSRRLWRYLCSSVQALKNRTPTAFARSRADLIRSKTSERHCDERGLVLLVRKPWLVGKARRACPLIPMQWRRQGRLGKGQRWPKGREIGEE